MTFERDAPVPGRRPWRKAARDLLGRRAAPAAPTLDPSPLPADDGQDALGIATFDTGTGTLAISIALGIMGYGMGLAMAPATDAIMGSLPRAKAGVGSAMNDVVRELGGTLGVAVLGSVLTSSYGSGMDEATAGLPPAAAAAAGDQVGAAHEIGAQLGGRAGATLIDSANSAFVDAMATTATLAAVAAVIGALIALALLPSRDRAERPALLGADVLEPAVA